MTMTLDNTTATQTKTAQERFNAALKNLRSVGIKTKMNYSSCCRSCANLGTDPYIAMYGGQGNAYGWVEGVMYYRSDIAAAKRHYRTPSQTKRVERVFIEFNDINAAEAAAVAFGAEGFGIEWNGKDSHCVEVKMF